MISPLLLMLAAAGSGERCALEGWTIDTDPAGLRVHAGPALASREIGRIPPPFNDHGDLDSPWFDIVDVQDGWVRIARAQDTPARARSRRIFGGTGWVHGSRVRFNVQSTVGRARPDLRAPIVLRLDDELGDAGARLQPITGCNGGWARLRYRIPKEYTVSVGPRTGEAWFGGICGNEHTTCDGVSEERSAPAR